MKLIIFILMFCSTTLHAQLQPGQFLVGGSASFRHEKVDGGNVNSSKDNTLIVSPAIGVFVFKKFATGLNVAFTKFRSIPVSNDQGFVSTSGLSVSPFVRYYILNENKPFNLLTQLSYDYTAYLDKVERGYRVSDDGDGFTISAGPAIFLSRHVALEFLIGYRSASRPAELGDERSVVSSVGLQIYLGRSKKYKTPA